LYFLLIYVKPILIMEIFLLNHGFCQGYKIYLNI
jgi:hypothetical protein